MSVSRLVAATAGVLAPDGGSGDAVPVSVASLGSAPLPGCVETFAESRYGSGGSGSFTGSPSFGAGYNVPSPAVVKSGDAAGGEHSHSVPRPCISAETFAESRSYSSLSLGSGVVVESFPASDNSQESLDKQ